MEENILKDQLFNEVKRFLKVDNSNEEYDDLIRQAVAMAIGFVESECAIDLIDREYKDVFIGGEIIRREYLDPSIDGVYIIVKLRHRPIKEINSIKVDDFEVDINVLIRGSWLYIGEDGERVEVVYKTGYVKVPDDLWGALVRISSVFFMDSDGRLNLERMRAGGEEVAGWHSYFDDRVRRILENYKRDLVVLW